MSQKVKPIKVKEMRVRDIPIGEFFSLNGAKFIMVCPYNSYNDFASDVLAIVNGECKKTTLLGDSIALVRYVVRPRSK